MGKLFRKRCKGRGGSPLGCRAGNLSVASSAESETRAQRGGRKTLDLVSCFTGVAMCLVFMNKSLHLSALQLTRDRGKGSLTNWLDLKLHDRPHALGRFLHGTITDFNVTGQSVKDLLSIGSVRHDLVGAEPRLGADPGRFRCFTAPL